MSERHVTFDAILNAVSAVTGFGPTEIRSQRRLPALQQARCAAWWLATQMTPLTMPTIGRLSGGRDHSVVTHGVEQAALLRESDGHFRLVTETLLATLRALEARGILALSLTIDPVATARRVLAAPEREAVRVSTYDIVAMSRLVVEMFGESDDPTPSPLSHSMEIENAA